MSITNDNIFNNPDFSFADGITGTTAYFSGGVTAAAFYGGSGSFPNGISGSTAYFTGGITAAAFDIIGGFTGTTATFSGLTVTGGLTGNTGFFNGLTAGQIFSSGAIIGNSTICTNLDVTGGFTGNTGYFGGLLVLNSMTSGSATITGLTGGTATFNGLTILNGMTGNTGYFGGLLVLNTVTAAGMTCTGATFGTINTNGITGTTGYFVGMTITGLTGNTATFNGLTILNGLTGNTGYFGGLLTLSTMTCSGSTITGLTGGTATFNGLTGTTATFGGVTITGGLTGVTAAFTGNVTQQRTWLRAYMGSSTAAGGSIPNTTNFGIGFDSLDTQGGGSSNFGWTAGNSTFVIPTSGMYSVKLQTVWPSNGSGYRAQWMEINNSGSPTTARAYGIMDLPATSSSFTCLCSSFDYKFAQNDTIQPIVYQTSGGLLNLGGGYNSTHWYSYIHITRLYE